MIVATVTNCHTRHPKRKTTNIKLVPRTISILGRFVDNLIKGRYQKGLAGNPIETQHLVECWKNVVSKLDFRNRGVTNSCNSNTEASNSLLSQGSVENSIFAYMHVSNLTTLAPHDEKGYRISQPTP